MKSVQEVSKHVIAQRALHGKSDVRYWLRSVFRPSYTRRGKRYQVADWAAKVQHGGRRETISLGTTNKAAAAAKARDLYLLLQSRGWDETLAKFRPRSQRWNTTSSTVGEFIQQVEAIWSGNQKTLGDYVRAFRKIVSDIFRIDLGRSKFDYRTGGRDIWVQKVNAVMLRHITPNHIQKWKVAFLARAGNNPVKRRAASVSVNSLLRQAKSLFSPGILKFVTIDIPSSPFDGVAFEPRRSMRYQSSFDVETIIRTAQTELPAEQLKVFLLAIMAGLRRNEIDKLQWSAFNWQKGTILISATEFFSPKSEDSTGVVEVDPEAMELFRGSYQQSSGDFVIESSVPPRPRISYSHYRCERIFAALNKWLRSQGIKGNRPLHTLRKEYGSQVCAKHGIYAASRALRHGDIAITSQHYLDKRQSAMPGLGGFLVLRRRIPLRSNPRRTG